VRLDISTPYDHAGLGRVVAVCLAGIGCEGRHPLSRGEIPLYLEVCKRATPHGHWRWYTPVCSDVWLFWVRRTNGTILTKAQRSGLRTIGPWEEDMLRHRYTTATSHHPPYPRHARSFHRATARGLWAIKGLSGLLPPCCRSWWSGCPGCGTPGGHDSQRNDACSTAALGGHAGTLAAQQTVLLRLWSGEDLQV
jgi:hypothetical protein